MEVSLEDLRNSFLVGIQKGMGQIILHNSNNNFNLAQ
jgi:hypothetical protein